MMSRYCHTQIQGEKVLFDKQVSVQTCYSHALQYTCC